MLLSGVHHQTLRPMRPFAFATIVFVSSSWLLFSASAQTPTKTEEPALSDAASRPLVAALIANDHTKLRRLGASLGAHGLFPLLSHPNRSIAMAAIAASGGAEEYWTLLPALANAASHPDHSLAIAAAYQGRVLSSDLDSTLVEEREIPNFDLGVWQTQWLQVASDPHRWLDIRIASLETATALASLPGQPAVSWKPFLQDPVPTMRAAALQLLPHAPAFSDLVKHQLQAETSSEVSLHAGIWLCGPVHSQRSDPPLGDDAISTLLALVADSSLPATDRAQLLPCLLQSPSAANQTAISALMRDASPQLRQRLRQNISQ